MTPIDCRWNVPFDILEELTRYCSINDVINFAIAARINIQAQKLPNTKIHTTDYISIISDDIDVYRRIVTQFDAKVGGEVLLYVIKRRRVDILMLFNFNCRVYYDDKHLFAAIATNNIEVLEVVLEKYKMLDMIKNKIYYDAICIASENVAFDTLDYFIVKFDVPGKILLDCVSYMIKYDNNMVKLIDYCKIDMRLMYQHLQPFDFGFDFIREAVNRGIFTHDSYMIVGVIDRNLSNTSHDVKFVKWAVSYIKSKCNKRDFSNCINKIFESTIRLNFTLCVWIHKNFKINKKINFNVYDIKTMKFLYKNNYPIIHHFIDPCVGSYKLQKWYHKTTKNKVTTLYLKSLLLSNSYDMFMHVWNEWEYDDIEINNMFSHGNERTIQFLLDRGYKPSDPNYAFAGAINVYSSIEKMQKLYSLCSTIEYKISMFSYILDDDMFKWLVDTFPQEKDNKYKIVAGLIYNKSLNKLLMILHWKVSLMESPEIARAISYCILNEKNETIDFLIDKMGFVKNQDNIDKLMLISNYNSMWL